jgi:hypothetical protein
MHRQALRRWGAGTSQLSISRLLHYCMQIGNQGKPHSLHIPRTERNKRYKKKEGKLVCLKGRSMEKKNEKVYFSLYLAMHYLKFLHTILFLSIAKISL